MEKSGWLIPGVVPPLSNTCPLSRSQSPAARELSRIQLQALVTVGGRPAMGRPCNPFTACWSGPGDAAGIWRASLTLVPSLWHDAEAGKGSGEIRTVLNAASCLKRQPETQNSLTNDTTVW
jgi:hypothetical protein